LIAPCKAKAHSRSRSPFAKSIISFLFGGESNRAPWALQFNPSLLNHHRRPLQRQARHDRRHEHVGPARAGTEHAQRGQQHGQVPEHVIARANPRGSHIGVAPAVAPQQSRRSGICRQSGKPMTPMVKACGNVPCHTCPPDVTRNGKCAAHVSCISFGAAFGRLHRGARAIGGQGGYAENAKNEGGVNSQNEGRF